MSALAAFNIGMIVGAILLAIPIVIGNLRKPK